MLLHARVDKPGGKHKRHLSRLAREAPISPSLPTGVAMVGVRPYAAENGRREEPRPRPAVIVLTAIATVAVPRSKPHTARGGPSLSMPPPPKCCLLRRRPSPRLQSAPLQSPPLRSTARPTTTGDVNAVVLPDAAAVIAAVAGT